MPRTLRNVFLVVVIELCLVTFAAAASKEELRGYQVRELTECSRLLEKYTAEMQQTPMAEWSTEQVELCLYYSMAQVHLALALYASDFEALPAKPEDVVTAGYLERFPGNPCADWAPLQVLDAAAPFAPGALVYQVCPPEYYSFVANDVELPLSYELSIYAPSEDYATPVDPHPIEHNAAWAVVPECTLAMIGLYNEPAFKTLEKRAARSAKAE